MPEEISNYFILEEIKKLQNLVHENQIEILKKIEEVATRVEEVNLENKHLTEKIEQLERKTKKNSIIIFGINTENYSIDNLTNLILNFFEQKLEIKLNIRDLNNIYAIGRNSSKPIVVEFVSFLTKLTILRETKKLKDTNIYINHDLTNQQQCENKRLRDHLKLAKSKNLVAFIKNNKLHINGEIYTAIELPNIEEVHVENEKPQSAPATPQSRKRSLDEIFQQQALVLNQEEIVDNTVHTKRQLRNNSTSTSSTGGTSKSNRTNSNPIKTQDKKNLPVSTIYGNIKNTKTKGG